MKKNEINCTQQLSCICWVLPSFNLFHIWFAFAVIADIIAAALSFLYLFPSEVWWLQFLGGQDISRWPLPTSVLSRLGPELCWPNLCSAGFQKVKNNHFKSVIKISLRQLDLKCAKQRPQKDLRLVALNAENHFGSALQLQCHSSFSFCSDFRKDWFRSVILLDPISSAAGEHVDFYL